MSSKASAVHRALHAPYIPACRRHAFRNSEEAASTRGTRAMRRARVRAPVSALAGWPVAVSQFRNLLVGETEEDAAQLRESLRTAVRRLTGTDGS
ncbi:hypothetical protein PV419_15565 [Streptomyces sp. ME19-01-6]|nr:hypothetical protein [Streptomyces sp. ME19-01-6]MDX3227086.1 hypothetical protein [Streptomyces sp. ME19-01-6]